MKAEIMPSKTQQLISKNAKLSKSGHPSRAQSYDYVLEEENKGVKSWIPRGIPKYIHWLRACRNYESLKTMKQLMFNKEIGISSDEFAYDRDINLDEAINNWRSFLNKENYIGPAKTKHDKEQRKHHTSISGVTLDESLINFTRLAMDKREKRFNQIYLESNSSFDRCLQQPVPVTPEERATFMSPESWAVPDIDNTILDRLQLVDQKFRKHYLERFVKEIIIKRLRKQCHLQFLKEINILYLMI